ncbi:hypothetical protein QW131_01535 [Roseibium salinum]|nr:hypothetical protein [Roseibium salinum]
MQILKDHDRDLLVAIANDVSERVQREKRNPRGQGPRGAPGLFRPAYETVEPGGLPARREEPLCERGQAGIPRSRRHGRVQAGQ